MMSLAHIPSAPKQMDGISTSFTWRPHPPTDKQAEQSSSCSDVVQRPFTGQMFCLFSFACSLLPVWRFKVSPSQWCVVTVMNNMLFSSSSCPGLDYPGQGCVQGNGCKEPRAEPRGTAHSALILPKRRGLSSGYPSWQAGLSKHGPLSPLFLSLALQMQLSIAHSELFAWFWDLKCFLTWDRCCLKICYFLVCSQSPFCVFIHPFIYLFIYFRSDISCLCYSGLNAMQSWIRALVT